ncbi:hypothetical protein DSO57_1029700 [Entomophthora muscae]|uniref:Uncharacterized protein n=1 Tax=Entomophthora muscae TaxID=34485 RepID=A0ACC2S394_9FUNG|nr:hypothetical protein DSO57_1029700 [Entomophthora muscae]
MPPKPLKKALFKASKASKDNNNPLKAKKFKAAKKKPAKAKVPPKTSTSSHNPKETIPTSSHSPFFYSPSDPQEKLFNFNHHYDHTSETEEEQKHQPELGTHKNDKIELWNVNTAHNICNQNGAFVVPITLPESNPTISKKGCFFLQVSKQQAQPASKVPNKQLCNLQSNYPAT